MECTVGSVGQDSKARKTSAVARIAAKSAVALLLHAIDNIATTIIASEYRRTEEAAESNRSSRSEQGTAAARFATSKMSEFAFFASIDDSVTTSGCGRSKASAIGWVQFQTRGSTVASVVSWGAQTIHAFVLAFVQGCVGTLINIY